MIFRETELPGAYLIELEHHSDERGFFARSFCVQEFQTHGLNPSVVQCNISYNHTRGTLRGMHYQIPPSTESKLIRCTAGSIYDVIVDLRPNSDTRFQWLGVELTAGNRRMLYIPERFAHGFLTLDDDTEVCYQMGARYSPEAARGFRWNDARVGVEWPIAPTVMSARDRNYPDLSSAALAELGP